MAPDPVLLMNASTARGSAGSAIRRLVDRSGIRVLTPAGPSETAEMARALADDGCTRVIVAGGDGTWHHAIQGLARTRAALGLVPAGSGNDLARALGIPLGAGRAWRVALEGPVRRIDLGAIGARLFAGIAGVGFDGDVAAFVNENMVRHRGRWAYPYAMLRTLHRFRPPVLSIDSADGSFHGEAMIAVLANSPYFGGGMCFAPTARMDDGQLELIVVERISKWKLLGLFPRVYGGSHLAHPRVRSLRVRRATVRSEDPRTMFADGEPVAAVGPEGTVVEVLPAALAVAAPPTPAAAA